MSNLLNIKDQNGNWIPIPVITNGIQSITQNQDYTLTITLNDGTTYTTTSIKGEDGQDYVLTENDKQEIAGLVDVPVDDVQINGTSVVSNGTANIPITGTNDFGVIKIGSDYGIAKNSDNRACIQKATDVQIKNGSGTYRPITPDNQHNAVFYGLAKASGDTSQSQSNNAVGAYTDSAKTAIQQMIGFGVDTITVNSTTPVITAQENTRYVCGEVTSLEFTPCANGVCEIMFTSGTTQTVLALPETVKMPEWFEVEPNHIYEINILDGVYGVVMSWET